LAYKEEILPLIFPKPHCFAAVTVKCFWTVST